MEDIERLLINDIRDKKRIGNNIHNRVATRKGSVGALRTPYAYMTTRERKKLNGDVKTYTKALGQRYSEFSHMSKDEQKNQLEIWREEYTNKEIAKSLGISGKKLYEIVNELKVKRKKRVDKGRKRGKMNVDDTTKSTLISDDYEASLMKNINNLKLDDVRDYLVTKENEEAKVKHKKLMKLPTPLKYLITVNHNAVYGGASEVRYHDSTARKEYYYNSIYRLRKLGLLNNIEAKEEELRHELINEMKEKIENKYSEKEIFVENPTPSTDGNFSKDEFSFKDESSFVNSNIENNIPPKDYSPDIWNESLANIVERKSNVVEVIPSKDSLKTDTHVEFKNFKMDLSGVLTAKQVIRRLKYVLEELEDMDGILDLKLSINEV